MQLIDSYFSKIPPERRALLPKMFNGTADGWWLFCLTYLPKMFQDFHHGREMIAPARQMLEMLLDPNTKTTLNRRIVTVWYRSGGKTTTAQAALIYFIVGKAWNDFREKYAAYLNKPFNRWEWRVRRIEINYGVIYGHDEQKIYKALGTIKNAFTNKLDFKLLVNDFGHLLEKSKKSSQKANIYDIDEDVGYEIKKNERELKFTHGVRIEGYGMGQSFQGANESGTRPDLFLGDDLESPQERYSADQFKKNYDYVINDFFNTIDKHHGRMHIIGTNLAVGCTVDKLLEHPMWKHNHFPHLCEPIPMSIEEFDAKEFTATDPFRYPMDMVKEMFADAVTKEEGLKGFYRDYFNIAYDPNSLEVHRVKKYHKNAILVDADRRLLRYVDWSKPKSIALSIGIDGGGAKQGNNKTAIVCSALTSDDELFVVDALLVNAKTLTPDKKEGYFHDIYRMAQKYKCTNIVFEAMTGGYQNVFEQLEVFFEEQDKLHSTRYRTYLMPYRDTEKSKRDRIFPVFKKYIEQEKFYIDEDMFKVFEKQVGALSAGGGGEDDLLDGIYLSLQGVDVPLPYTQSFQRVITKIPTRDSTLKKMSRLKL